MRTACCVIVLAVAAPAAAMDLVRQETRTDLAVSTFGVDGTGVTVAVLDRGIEITHPDFRNADGTTRIKAMLDMSGFSLCSASNPAPVEYTEAQINAALGSGPAIGMRDAVGHGTATLGTAAGNGRALGDLRYRGIAPKADLVVVKLVSEGAVAHDSQPSEAAFQGCIDQAIDWLMPKLDALHQPAVMQINSGTQWGPMDGTSAVSRKLDASIGGSRRGRVFIIPSGDEGSLPNHSGIDFSAATPGVIGIGKTGSGTTVMTGRYTGSVPAEVTIHFNDGTTVGPIQPATSVNSNGVQVFHYAPGAEFYPWQSTGGSRSLWMGITGHATAGTVTIHALGSGTGHFDLYGDVTGPNLTPLISMTDHLVPGRLTDYATTRSVIVVGDYVIRTSYVDIDGIARSITNEGLTNELWLKSSEGPTRDGRSYGVDIAAPGQNEFSSVSVNGYWHTLRGNLPQSGNGYYIRFGGTSGSSPIVTGAVALMLQAQPALTANQARKLLRQSARADSYTGAVPNTKWGYGKLDVYEAVRLAKDELYFDSFD